MSVRLNRLLVAVGLCSTVGGIVFLVVQAAGVRAQQPQAQAAASIPRARDGKPDLSGFWQAMTTANYNIQDHSAEPGVPAGQGIVEGDEIPYQDWALEQKRKNYFSRATLDPETKCFAPGVPRAMYMPYPFQIVQDPSKVYMIFEYAFHNRTIFTDGSKHPRGGLETWMGDSRAHWEGDTLVNDVADFNDLTWFDRAGNFHSTALHVVERYTLMDRNSINYEATIEDPKVFTRPWKMRLIFYRHLEENFRILEYLCWAFPLEKHYPYPSIAQF